MPLQIDCRVGLGFVDHQGHGLEILLPLNGSGDSPQGVLARYGEDMEGGISHFPVSGKQLNGPGKTELRIAFSQGRILVYEGEQLLTETLAGFPLKFSGFPVVACQNARCEIHSIEITWR